MASGFDSSQFLMLELYYLFYRIPKMMTRAARASGRSAVAWSLIGIGVWLGTELVVLFGLGAVVSLLLSWEERVPVGLRLLAYVIALLAALISVTLVKRHLLASSRPMQTPPLPPFFDRNT